jgi:predicted ATPase
VGDELSAGEVDALSRFIPDFEELIDDVEADNDSDDDDSVSDPSLTDHKDSLTKIMIAIRDFLRIVTEQAPNPIVLWLDDLQWADAASLELIDCIANDEEQQYFLLVATYRGNEVEVGHPVHRWKKQAEDLTKQKFTNPTTTLTLKGLNIVDVNKLLADLTNLDEGATFPLATLVMTRTNGNMFFVIQLLEHLQNEDLLVYDASNFKWTWDLDKVRGTALSDHVVDLVASRIQRHPDHVQRVLQLAACLGFKIDPNVLEIVKSAIPGVDNIEEHLNFCVEERMMERLSDGRVKFFHDRIHQATMSLLPDGVELTKLHLRIGVLLWGHIQSLSKAGQKVEDKLLFLCAEHMSNGSDQISDVIMKLRLVQLNNMVGVKATQLSAFATAAEYFERGLELLDSIGHKWETHHTLCMSMQVAFAEVL